MLLQGFDRENPVHNIHKFDEVENQFEVFCTFFDNCILHKEVMNGLVNMVEVVIELWRKIVGFNVY